MQSIAFMNIKKTGGGASADNTIIRKIADRHKHFIRREIELINPDIIIAGVGKTEILQIILQDIKFKNSGFDIWVAKHKGYKVIDFYHPSYRVPRAMSYALLKAVYESKVFQEL